MDKVDTSAYASIQPMT